MTKRKKPDPYKTLGIDKDASAKDIKDAYRRRAKEAHPDTGGSEEEFERVKTAHLVLSNAASRAKFDETGEFDDPEVDNTDNAACQIIAGLIGEILEGEEDPERCDLPNAMVFHLSKQLKEIDASIKKLKRTKSRAERMQKKFKRKSKGENMMSRMLEWQIRKVVGPLRQQEDARKAFSRAIEIVKDYDFEGEQRVQSVYMTIAW